MTLSRMACVITTIFSWLGIRFLRFANRGRATGARPDNLPRFFSNGISRSEPSARGRYRRTTLNPSVGEDLKMALNRHRQLIEHPLCAGATSGFWAAQDRRQVERVDASVQAIDSREHRAISGPAF
jgi:hypothetical protein